MSNTMTVIIDGEETKRTISHMAANRITGQLEDVPKLFLGEEIIRTADGNVIILKAANR